MKFRILIGLTFILFSLQNLAQNNDVRFRSISPPGGFSFQAIHSFNQDKFGYMWMGGFDGVIRYDSKETIRFVHNAGDENGLPSNTITGIVVDKQNNIWVSTNKGLCKFNHNTQQFNRIRYKYKNGSRANDQLFSIQVDGQGTLWIADEFSLGYLDTENMQMNRIIDGIASKPRLLYGDEINRMWLGTEDGSVYLVKQKEKKVIKKIDGPGSIVRTICTSANQIWVGYESHGARTYDLNGNLKKHYSYTVNPEHNIESASIRKIWRDTQGQIWIGSYHGLFKSIGNHLIRFDHDQYDGLPHNSIFDIFEDQQGGIWIGTWSGGVAYLHHSDNRFNNYRHTKKTNSISDNMISSFAQTPNGDIYIGTELFGLNKFNLTTSTFTPIQVRESKGILNIKDIETDNRGGLWIASAFNGVYYRKENTQKFVHFPAGEEDGKHVSATGIYGLCKSDSGMWIATSFGGVNFYSFETQKISFKSNLPPYNSVIDVNIRSLSIDNKENMWITTANGLLQIHMPTGKSKRFTTTSIDKYKTNSQSFYFAKQLSDNNIWIGTGGDGIYIYDYASDRLRHFDANGLIKGKDVYGIIETNLNIWITTNDGLILFNSAEETSRRFVITDGIQGNLFNPNSIFKDRDKNLYFGGTNGFSMLEPKTIRTNNRPPNIFINNITVNNRKIVPTQNAINVFEGIVLAPNETSLSFHFASDNFLLPEKNEYQYRLTNYINEWVQDASQGSANFVNIPPGEYIFEVKACNNDGIWNENPARITVVIKQFWYKSDLALLLYSLVIFTIVLLVIRFFRERSKLKKELLIEKIKHEHEEHLNEMKLRFFTNISHEFRTPLTLINGPIKYLLRADNLTDEQHKQLDTVKRNSNRLLQLINQIMDLRKVEKGLAKLNISRIELVDFVNERMLNFSEEARMKNINLAFNYGSSSCIIEADEEKLDKIIYNLLSNAFKFTPKNGNISISLRGNKVETGNYFSNQLSFGKLDNEDFIELVVLDSGHGIDSEDLPNVFDRFEQGKSSKIKRNSTGIGLNLCKDFTLMHRGVIIVQSTPGKGTRFSIQLPTKQKAQKILYDSHEKVKNIKSWESQIKLETKEADTNTKTKILVVEDNEDLREYIVQLLKNHYTVLFAENGKKGLEILKSNNVQLIISDVMMPIMDGFEFCQTIKSQIETSHIPVILLTALSSAENTSTGLEKGADAYISKPFDETVLFSQINNLLLQRKRLQESYAEKFITKQPIDIGSLDNYFLNKINTIIEENITNEHFSVDKLASEMGLSRSQLHRKLKQLSNSSTSEYISIVKIKKATALLASKNYTIDEIAFKTGFNSHSYFTKCFKKIHGQSPKEYLKSLQ